MSQPPPRIADRLLRSVLPVGSAGDSIRGDLLEEFQELHQRDPRAARSWYRREALILIGTFVTRRIAFGPSSAIEKFVGFGLPGLLGPIIGIVEVLAALLLLAGVLARGSAAVLGVIIVGALVTVQIPRGISPGLERGILILAAISVLLTQAPGRLTWPRKPAQT